MVVHLPNGEVCEDAEYYGIFHDEEDYYPEIQEIQQENEDFIDNDYKEDIIYLWEHRMLLD